MRSLAGASRYCSGRVTLPDPLADPARFAAEVFAAVARHSVDTLIPITEGSLLAILPERAKLAGCLIPFPDDETFRRVCDKAEVLRVAALEAIAIPAQVVIEARGAPLPPAMPPFPVVLKPSRSVTSAGGTGPQALCAPRGGPPRVR